MTPAPPYHLEPIPRPPGHMLVGNLLDLDAHHPIDRLMELARKYGPIFELALPGRGSRIVVSGHALVDELCDESRFDKVLGPGLNALAEGPVGRGLITSETADPNWSKAHNVLLAAFSMDAMRGYFPQMQDIALQLMQKWERLNSGDTIDVPADMTRLTLDTIALCGFNYRFNSFYRDTPHPFVVAMLGVLEAAQARPRELPLQSRLHPACARQLRADQQLLLETVQHLIEERRRSGAVGTIGDLLDCMLTGVDRQSGEKLDDANVIAQCITFLIAGHETTSGLLSFALYALLKHPDVLARGYEEVDRVLGTDMGAPPTYAQVHQMPYVSQIIDETLRLWPTAPGFTRYPYEDTVIGGKYRLAANSAAVVLTGMLHRDREVWGDDPEAFNPDHFNAENRPKIPPNAYKPFGTGQRACIGRQFALQEAVLVLSMLLQRYRGVCSKYLAALSADATLYGFIRKPAIPFHPPENPHVPMIVVGPGTGVAPFRGFLQEREALRERGVPIGPSLLFFGCRDPLQDLLYEEELRKFEATGVTRLFCAFSREPGGRKTYVQQAIGENGAEVWRLLQEEAVVFVCGEASRMAPQRRQAFVDLFCERTGAGAADGQAWLAGLVAGRRYLEDIWASS